jgi:hypothetical protein
MSYNDIVYKQLQLFTLGPRGNCYLSTWENRRTPDVKIYILSYYFGGITLALLPTGTSLVISLCFVTIIVLLLPFFSISQRRQL